MSPTKTNKVSAIQEARRKLLGMMILLDGVGILKLNDSEKTSWAVRSARQQWSLWR